MQRARGVNMPRSALATCQLLGRVQSATVHQKAIDGLETGYFLPVCNIHTAGISGGI